jgi:hypothetical protein
VIPEYKFYVKQTKVPMRPWVPELGTDNLSISAADRKAGSPKVGDMIAWNPDNPADRWLVAEAYFKANYKEAGGSAPAVVHIPNNTPLGEMFDVKKLPLSGFVTTLKVDAVVSNISNEFRCAVPCGTDIELRSERVMPASLYIWGVTDDQGT